MSESVKINHDAVLRAQVALLGSEKPSVAQRVAAYRVLVQVSPLAYLPLLAVALGKYARREFSDRPDIALTLLAESVDAARRMYALEPARSALLVGSLREYRGQLARTGRQSAIRAVDEEIARVAG
ncbi:hypothetical protein ACIA6C_12770 [Streptomyces sp. NPDC051578]|uniref:hypothetical protein n=1 Tax=Streptomyces sp. NPDC051578 TaxID=3365662 RepID=UPI0037959E8A